MTISDARLDELEYEDWVEVDGGVVTARDAMIQVRAERDALQATVDRVKAIHTEGSSEVVESTPDGPRVSHFTFHCDVCVDVRGEHEEWPCPTVAALEGEKP